MKKVSILSVIIITLAAAYYLVLFLPSQKRDQTAQNRRSFIFKKQIECKNVCGSIYKEDKEQLTYAYDPRYAYNETLNACFYSGGGVSTNPKSTTRRVVNCQTNEEVLTYMTIENDVVTKLCGSATCVSSAGEFENRAKEFMGD